jgi:ABC-type branched-subunit amino acid transport system substrate-binding protein
MRACVLALRFAALATLVGAVASCSAESPPPGTLVFGALLPFTGEQAAMGANVERTLLIVKDLVNQAGGLRGSSIDIATFDSHSDPARGVAEAGKLLSLPELQAMLGPEELDLAAAIQPMLQQRPLVNFLPGLATPATSGSGNHTFRVGPSARVIAGALAERMHRDGVTKVGIVYEPGSYGESLSRLARCEFKRASGNDAVLVAITPDASVDDAFRQLVTSPPEAILLIAYPKSGAKVVLNWTVSHGGGTRWYLAPTLDTDEFVNNVIPGSLDNSSGISPAKQTYAGTFDTQFNDRWADFPMTLSYYYYDSIALLSLALEAAHTKHTPLADEVFSVSGPPGELIGWNDLGRGLQLVRQGVEINYDGLTGNVDIEPNGDVQQSLLRDFSVVSGKIKHSSLPFDYSQFLTTQCADP